MEKAKDKAAPREGWEEAFRAYAQEESRRRTAYHLVDTENRPVGWVRQLSAREGDHVLLFRSANACKINIPLEDAVRLANSKVKVRVIECVRGKPQKNALDFQLISHAGYLIGTDRRGAFRIYSNDTGFDPAVAYWKRQGIDIARVKGKGP